MTKLSKYLFNKIDDGNGLFDDQSNVEFIYYSNGKLVLKNVLLSRLVKLLKKKKKIFILLVLFYLFFLHYFLLICFYHKINSVNLKYLKKKIMYRIENKNHPKKIFEILNQSYILNELIKNQPFYCYFIRKNCLQKF